MKKNMGHKDRVVRTMIGVLMLLYGLVFQNMVGLVGLVFVAVGLSGFCPLYALLGIQSFRFED